MRDLAIEEEDELKIDYFFYTNTLEKSQILAKEIQKLDYTVHCEVTTNDKKLFVTTEMKMIHKILRKWVIEITKPIFTQNKTT